MAATAAKGGAEPFDPREAVRVELGSGSPLGATVVIPEYFVLFWTPVIGVKAAATYTALLSFLSTGRLLPTKGMLVRYLGFEASDLRESMVALARCQLVERNAQRSGTRLVFPPPLMSEEFAAQHMDPELARAHAEYLRAHGVAKKDRPESVAQLSLIDDDAVAPVAGAPTPQRTVRKQRRTDERAKDIVEHFRTCAAKALGVPKFEIRQYAREMVIANSFLHAYELEEATAIIDEFFRSEPMRARRVSSLGEVKAMAEQLHNRVQHKVTPSSRDPNSRVVVPTMPGYGESDEREPRSEW